MVSIIRTLRRGKMKEQQSNYGILVDPGHTPQTTQGLTQPGWGTACRNGQSDAPRSGHVDPSPPEAAETVAWDTGRGGLGVTFPASSLST